MRVTAHRLFSIALNCWGSRGTVIRHMHCSISYLYCGDFYIKLACLKGWVPGPETREPWGICHWRAWAENCQNVLLWVLTSNSRSSLRAPSCQGHRKEFYKSKQTISLFWKCKWETCFITASEWEPLAEESEKSQGWGTTFQSFHPAATWLCHHFLAQLLWQPLRVLPYQLPHQLLTALFRWHPVCLCFLPHSGLLTFSVLPAAASCTHVCK